MYPLHWRRRCDLIATSKFPDEQIKIVKKNRNAVTVFAPFQVPQNSPSDSWITAYNKTKTNCT